MPTYVSHTCTPYLPIGLNWISPLKLYCRNIGFSLRLIAKCRHVFLDFSFWFLQGVLFLHEYSSGYIMHTSNLVINQKPQRALTIYVFKTLLHMRSKYSVLGLQSASNTIQTRQVYIFLQPSTFELFQYFPSVSENNKIGNSTVEHKMSLKSAPQNPNLYRKCSLTPMPKMPQQMDGPTDKQGSWMDDIYVLFN